MAAKPMTGHERSTEAEAAGTEAAPLFPPASEIRVTVPPAATSASETAAAAVKRRRHRVSVIARTLETDIIPRLMLAHRAASPAAYLDSRVTDAPTEADIEAVLGLAMRADLQGALAYLEALRARGLGLERLYIELLAPVARRLGVMWEEDLCDFTAVTIGLSCLHQIVREYSPTFVTRTPRAEPDRRALLATMPGEQHSFGLLVVEQFFRGAGWDVWSGSGADRAEIIEAVSRVWFGVAGFSIASEMHLNGLAMLIRDVRRASRNAGLGILVGGPLFLEKPELVGLVGADATATDGRDATLQAETLLALLGRQV